MIGLIRTLRHGVLPKCKREIRTELLSVRPGSHGDSGCLVIEVGFEDDFPDDETFVGFIGQRNKRGFIGDGKDHKEVGFLMPLTNKRRVLGGELKCGVDRLGSLQARSKVAPNDYVQAGGLLLVGNLSLSEFHGPRR